MNARERNFQKLAYTEYGVLYDQNPFNSPEIKKIKERQLIVISAANREHKKYADFLKGRLSKMSTKFRFFDLGGLMYGKPFEGAVGKIPFQNIPCKPHIVEEALSRLPQGQLLLWLDSDTVPELPLKPIYYNIDICFSLRRSRSTNAKEGWINAGVIFFRNSPKTMEFIKLWKSLTNIVKGDQAALNYILHQEKFRRSLPTFLRSMRIVGLPTDSINCFYAESLASEVYIRHYKTDIRHLHPLHKPVLK